jgi:two-component system, NarL family, sensor kinase
LITRERAPPRRGPDGMAGAAMSVLVPDSARPGPEVMPIVVAHAERGIALQQALRAVLVVFVAATVIWLPPAVGAGACAVIAAGYVVAAIGLTWWLRGRGAAAIRWGWLGLYVDLAVLSAVSLIAGLSARQSWTSYVLLGGFFLLPVLAATQLRGRVCVAWSSRPWRCTCSTACSPGRATTSRGHR